MAPAKSGEPSGRSTSISSVSACVKVTLGFKDAEDFGGGISDTKLFNNEGSLDPAIGKLPMRCYTDPVSGEVWRLRKDQGHRLHHLASRSGPQSYAGGELPGCQGCYEPPICLSGADRHGQREDGHWTSSGPCGGSSPQSVQRKIRDSGGKSKAICSNRQSEVGHDGPAILEGDGRDLKQKSRSHLYKADSVGGCSKHTRSKEKGEGPWRPKGESHPVQSDFGGGVDAPGTDEENFVAEVSFDGLLACLIRWVLRSKTAFAAFLARSFHVRRSDFGPATAVFPLPIPHDGLFSRQSDLKLSRAKWKTLCHRRALHILTMALNYIHYGFRPLPMSVLGRRPSLAQHSVFRRLRALITACDRSGSTYPLPPGRSGFEFIAKLVELEKFAYTNSAFELGYGVHVREDDSTEHVVGRIAEEHRFRTGATFSPLHPYRTLEADRLKLSGQGKWDLQEYLDSCLWLPFQDPSVLLHGQPLGSDGPTFAREDQEENLKLAKLWDSKGLLAMFPSAHPTGLACRVFNAHKNEDVDRQIGDRRWFNAAECHPRGPSACLPAGQLATSLHCPRGHKLVGCAADRKDFYHQAAVTRERALTNTLPFHFEAAQVHCLSAWEEMLESTTGKVSRESHGDRYGMAPLKPLKEKDITSVVCGFKSLFQGDHLGVEFALESHTNLLKRGGLLADDETILGHHTFPQGPSWQGLVIDDYFAISQEKTSTPSLQAKSVDCLPCAVLRTSTKERGSSAQMIRPSGGPRTSRWLVLRSSPMSTPAMLELCQLRLL